MKDEITTNSFIKSYWNYFLELEEQFNATKRFVDFDKSNNSTFSIEYLKLLQATCSEIDVVAKIIAEYFGVSKKCDTIQKWGYELQKVYTNIKQISVRFNNDYDTTPWKNWEYEKNISQYNKITYRLKKDCQTPEWWTAYNKVKHERTSKFGNGQINYMRANQKNLIDAMSALFILESLFLEELCKLNSSHYERSKLFALTNNNK